MKYLFNLILIVLLFSCHKESESNIKPIWLSEAKKNLEQELLNKYGTEKQEEIVRGISQVADYWFETDGDQSIFEAFIRQHFIVDKGTRDALFNRFQDHLEKMNGYMDRIILNFRQYSDLDIGPVFPFDEIFAAYNPSAHISEDFFNNKLAFIVLLNFPLISLEERASSGETWTRRQWAETRLANSYIQRIPSDVSLEISRVRSESERYIANYNIWMHHLIDRDGKRLFPPKLRLLSHWNLRDEIRAQYANGSEGLERQKMIQRVMERIVDQTIPEGVINNPAFDWNPYTNKVTHTEIGDSDIIDQVLTDQSGNSEPNKRYKLLQKNFIAQKMADPHCPTMPNFIQRRFEFDREISEQRIFEVFDKLITSENLKKVSEIIKENLGRDLEPFDIWYSGFKPRGNFTETKLNQIVSQKYPTSRAFKRDIPRILNELGFSNYRADEIAKLIVVDPARGSGHAWGAQMRGETTHLRTRIGEGGMDYKGYNIAIHELGHNVEQVISINNIDHTLLSGVPNNAFTEAMAFIFQSRDLELLGHKKYNESGEAMQTLNDFWSTCEIAAVALVDNAIWHWMYDHPEASDTEIKETTIRIAREIWNRYFAPVFGVKDVTLLGIYSHMISYPLYLTDYPLGHLLAYQIEDWISKVGSVGQEFDRMARIGKISPDLWMLEATGDKISADALQNAVTLAIRKVRAN